jgi:uncharacterized protein YjbJ (UPF0337 family)
LLGLPARPERADTSSFNQFKEVMVMGLPNKDEVKGKFHQVKGEIKEKAGHALDDREMHDEGSAERAGGEVRQGFGKARRKVGEAIEDLGEAVRK